MDSAVTTFTLAPTLEYVSSERDPVELARAAARLREVAARRKPASTSAELLIRLVQGKGQSQLRDVAVALAANPHTPPAVAGTLLVPALIEGRPAPGYEPSPRQRAALEAASAVWPADVVDAVAALVTTDPDADWITPLELAAAVTTGSPARGSGAS